MLLLLCLTDSYVGESVCHNDSTLSKVVHLVEIMLPFWGHSQAKSQSRSHGRRSISLSLGHICYQLIAYLLNGHQRYLRCSLLSSFNQILQAFFLKISHYLALCEIHNRILDIRVEVDNSHDSVRSFAFDSVNVVSNTDLDNFFSWNVLEIFLVFLLTSIHAFIFSKSQLFFHRKGNISGRLASL